MKNQLKTMMGVAALTAAIATPASAELVAGWDFSDLAGDSATVPAALAANYNIQATGSSLTVAGDVVASAMRPGGSGKDDTGLQGGINGYATSVDPTFPQGVPSFNGGEYLGVTARGAATLEFDVSLAAPSSESWYVSLGAAALTPATDGVTDQTTIDISFGDTCGSAALVTSVVVGPEDTGVQTFLGQSASAGGCVILGLDGSVNQPLIDNVAIATPEPGMGAMLMVGITSLLAMARRRD